MRRCNCQNLPRQGEQLVPYYLPGEPQEFLEFMEVGNMRNKMWYIFCCRTPITILQYCFRSIKDFWKVFCQYRKPSKSISIHLGGLRSIEDFQEIFCLYKAFIKFIICGEKLPVGFFFFMYAICVLNTF